MKKKILIIMFLFFCFIPLSVKGESRVIFENTIDSIGGIRYENYLVYYPYNQTGKTGTNAWGYEISVNEFNVVIEKNANVTIQQGGYALSAHGTKKNELMNVEIGDIVNCNLNDMNVTIIRDFVESSYYLAKMYQQNAYLAFNSASRRFMDIDESLVTETMTDLNEKMSEIESLYQNENITSEQETQISSLSNQIKNLSEELIYYTSSTNSIEIRAMWHRPNATSIKENNLDGLINFLDRVKELGFNTLYVETYWNGYVSYRSDILTTHPQVSSFSYGEYGDDYIAALIGEAKKRDIDIHAWIHTFNAGNTTTISSAIKNEWLVEDYQGNTLHPNSYGGAYYLDPSNEEVLTFIDSMLTEMITKYDFAGIQLDYIRYYDNNYQTTPIRDSGYGELPENAFKNAYNLTGDVRTMILDVNNRELWNQWRQDNVTKAVKRFSKLLRSYNKNIIISADVVGNIDQAKSTYMQDWLQWVNKGYIDLICPMIYTYSEELVDNLSNSIYNSIGNLAYLSSGIAPIYYGYSLMNQHEQMVASSKYGGSAIFASHNVIGFSEIENSIKNGIYRSDAVSLFESADVLVKQIVHSINPLIELIKDDTIRSSFNQKLVQLSTTELNNPADYQLTMNEISSLILLSPYIQNESIETVIVDSLQRLYHSLDTKISRELIALGLYDPENENRPDPTTFDYPDNPTDPTNPINPTDPTEPTNPIDPQNPVEPSEPSSPDTPNNNVLLWVGLSSGITAISGAIFFILKFAKRKVI